MLPLCTSMSSSAVEVRVDQVRQVAHRLGFTRSEVTSLEQVVGGGERASTMLLHLLLVWQKQKHRGKEAGREELAAALYEEGIPDAAVKVDRRRECVCVCVTPCDAELGTHILSSQTFLITSSPPSSSTCSSGEGASVLFCSAPLP